MSKGNTKTEIVPVRFSKAEKEDMKKKSGGNLSSYIRSKLGLVK